jgi:PAS domain S-box-containing protein
MPDDHTMQAGQHKADTPAPAHEASWHGLFEWCSEGFVLAELIRDTDGAVVDWRYLEVNRAWEALLGMNRRQAIGASFRALNPQADAVWVEQPAAVVAARAPAIFCGSLMDGERWFEGRAFALEADRFTLLLLDVTARKKTEDEARQLVGLVEQSSDFIAVADPDGRVRFVNPAGLRMVGLADLAAARRTAMQDFFAPGERALVQERVLPAVQKDEFWGGDLEFRNFATGGNFPVHYTLFPLRDARGAVTGYGTVTRDLRQLRQTERRRAALLELGDQLRRLEDTGAMARAAAETMARVLGADRAGFGTIDGVAESIEVRHEWTAPGTASIAGTYRFHDYGAYIDALKRGEPVLFNDTHTDPRTAAQAGRWAAMRARAVINYPILEHGTMTALFLLHQAQPRIWSAEELAFARNVAERAWVAMQRLRAEQEVRDLAASLERQVAARTADRNRLWQLSTDIMLVAQFDGVVLAVNPAWTATLGWSELELLGRNLADLVHRDDLAESAAAAQAVAEGATVRRFDNRYRHKEGGYRWISWTAVPGEGLINAVGRDITEEKQKAEALELSEARLRSVFETTYQFQGLLTTDGIVLDANPVSLAAIEARLEDVLGAPFWATPWFSATPGLPEQVQAGVALAARGETVRQEIVANLPTGRRAFDFAMRPVFNPARDVIAIVPEAIELTERRAAEEQLRQAQKMEAVGQLTGGLAHDFNNLLTGITGGMALLRARLAQGRLDELERHIVAAEAAADRAAALTQRLLAFSRQQTLDPRLTDANRLTAGMQDLIERTVGQNTRLNITLADNLWRTLCDPNQLENALLNLAINARDAMPEGGRLTVATQNLSLDGRAALARDMVQGDYVAISVSDTGSGMPPAVVARAFDPFFTTKPSGQGTGLGLSMVYGFAKQSGGQARIHSVEGEGTTVRLYLPRFVGPAEEIELVNSVDDAPRAVIGETVLAVDDEPFVAMLITDVLEELGYAALDANDGPSGLKIVQSDQRIDLLITDVGLPGGMNGRQLADAARAVRPGLKVLFVTGYAEHGVLGDAQMAEGTQVITKPFAIETLAARIRAMIGGN